MTRQHYRMTLEEAHFQYKSGLISATALVYYYIRIRCAKTWKITLHQHQVCKELGIQKATFYKAIGRLREKDLIEWEAPSGLVISIPESINHKLSLQTVDSNGQIVDSNGQIVDSNGQIVDSNGQIVDSKSPKASSINSSDDSPNSYQISNRFLTSLSQEEREKFLSFGRKKAAQLPRPPELPDRWIEANLTELIRQFQATPEGKTSAPTRDFSDHPHRDEWIAQIRTARLRFIALGGPPEEEQLRWQFSEWAEANNLVWGQQS